MSVNSGMLSSERPNWATPAAFYHTLNSEFHFDYDVCAEASNAKHPSYWSEQNSCLDKQWVQHGLNFFMNPPYGRGISPFIQKAFEETRDNACVAVCLLPSRTDTIWWHVYVMHAREIRFVKGRLKFDDGKNSAPFPSAVVIFGEREEGQTSPIISTILNR